MMLALATTLVALPSTNAHSPPWDVPTWCYVAVTNNPIGVGQLMDIVFWLNAYPQQQTAPTVTDGPLMSKLQSRTGQWKHLVQLFLTLWVQDSPTSRLTKSANIQLWQI